MWNTHYSNFICYSQDKSMDQLRHLNRLLTVQPKISTEKPFKPDFLGRFLTKEEMINERNAKIDYENNILYRNVYNISNKPGRYDQDRLRPEKYPAHDKFRINNFYKLKQNFDIFIDNLRHQQKIKNIKCHYDTNDILSESRTNEYYKKNILRKQGKYKRPPSLDFISIDQLKKRLEFQINKILSQNKNTDYEEDDNNQNNQEEQNNKNPPLKNLINFNQFNNNSNSINNNNLDNNNTNNNANISNNNNPKLKNNIKNLNINDYEIVNENLNLNSQKKTFSTKERTTTTLKGDRNSNKETN